MSAGAAKAIGPGRPGEEGENGYKVFHRTYRVLTDNVTDGPNTVLGADGLPAMGSPYPGHPTAIVVGRYPTPLDKTRYGWHVEVVWSTHSIERDENPLLTKPEIEWGGESFDEPIPGTPRPTFDSGSPVSGTADSSDSSGTTYNYQNTNGNMGSGLLNAAGDPFDPPATRPNYYPVVRFTRNEATFTPYYAVYYGNTVNVGAWNGLAPRQAWLKPIEATLITQASAGLDSPDIRYWRVRYTFVLKAMTWDLALLNIGPNYLTGPNTSTTPYPQKAPFLSGGHPTKDLLKANGTRYSTTEQKIPVWIVKRVMREVDFAGLSINLNLALNDMRRIVRFAG